MFGEFWFYFTGGAVIAICLVLLAGLWAIHGRSDMVAVEREPQRERESNVAVSADVGAEITRQHLAAEAVQ